MMVRELKYYEENILNFTMNLGDHADCHNFVVSIKNKDKQKYNSENLLAPILCWCWQRE